MKAVADAWSGYGGSKNVHQLPLAILPAEMPHPSLIPPRAWLYGRLIQRGFVSLVIAPGGVGKSQLAMHMAVSMAAGIPLLGHRIYHQCNTWLFNLEDPIEEMNRRLAALMIHHRLEDHQLRNRLFMNGADDRGLCIAKHDDMGNSVVFPDRDQIVALIRASQVGAIFIDPFVRSHGFEENDNPMMDMAMKTWASICREADCACVVVHHTRKGDVDSIEAARGGSALKDAARASVLLHPMTPKEAEDLAIEKADRWRYVKFDTAAAKQNMAPPGEADWLVMHQHELGNPSEDYPEGDTVTALAPWQAPKLFEGISNADCNRVLDIIDAAPEGELFAPTQKGGPSARWVGNVLTRELGTPEPIARQIVATWLKNGLLAVVQYQDKKQRKPRDGVNVINAKRPS